jgi:hypothetical protein
MRYGKIPLGSSCHQYAEEVLANGKTLAAALAASDLLKDSEVYAFLPAGTDASRIADCRWGGMASREQSLVQTATLIEEFLSNENCVCVLENRCAHPSDPVLQKCSSEIWTFDEEIYHVLRTGANREATKKAMVEADSSMFLVGCCSHSFSVAQHPARHAFDRQQLESLCINASHVIVEAFDGEAFLVFTSPSGQLRP